MKRIITVLAFALTALTATAQKVSWKEMHDFHAVMGKTFHPAEEGNLKPIKDSATVLFGKAKTWQASKIPTGYDAKVVAPILKQLVAKCSELQKAVAAKKDDKTLTKLITQAHETFHEIMEKCNKESKHH